MAEATWTYSDWITYDVGNATRLSRLRLHIQEVSDKISRGNFAQGNVSHDYSSFIPYLESLKVAEQNEAAARGTNQSRFTRGKAVL